MTELADTCAPGRTRIFSTRPSVVDGSQRVSSGTSVPRPRTCRMIEPRLTVSTRTVVCSTVGVGRLTAGDRDGHANNNQCGNDRIASLSEPLPFENRRIANDIGHRENLLGLSAHASSLRAWPGVGLWRAKAMSHFKS